MFLVFWSFLGHLRSQVEVRDVMRMGPNDKYDPRRLHKSREGRMGDHEKGCGMGCGMCRILTNVIPNI